MNPLATIRHRIGRGARIEDALARMILALAGFNADQTIILAALKELKTMSQTNQQIIDAANAALQTSIDKVQTDVTAIATELQANIPAAGSVPSTESVAALQAQVTRLQTVAASLDALVVPPAPTVAGAAA